MPTTKPTCPIHPNAGVTDARTPGTRERMWVCLKCGQVLGRAPEREAEWESFSYGADEQGELDG